jgi:hypothetical protein
VLRSHFFIGVDCAGRVSPEELAEHVPDTLGLALMKHAYTELTYLARFLPALFEAENRDTRTLALPW